MLTKPLRSQYNQVDVAEWYYIGHYGQLGPLTREQLDELIDGGVIVNDTYVWRTGMADWLHADAVFELRESFHRAASFSAPPPPPLAAPPPVVPTASREPVSPMMMQPAYSSAPSSYYRGAVVPGRTVSDKSRTLAGLLQIIPGAGRIYLGYAAYGVVQLILTVVSCGFLILWSWIDGFFILLGGLKMDGYGRVFND